MMSEPLNKFDSPQSLLRTISSTQANLTASEETLGIPSPYIYIKDILPSKSPDFNNRNTTLETIYYPPDKHKEKIHEPVVFPKEMPLVQERFIPLQKWEGVVECVTDDYFVARLVDQTGEMPDEVAEFILDEVSTADRSLVKLGAIFYWNIGYEESIGGQRKRSSIIRFRRLPAWSAHELETAKYDAENTRDILNWR